jgi:AcrR family transcriptional regulator
MNQPSGKRRGRPSAGIREAILSATLALVEEEGLRRLTTKEIAERAGASEASVYYHFKDKVGLVQAVIEAGLDPLHKLDVGDFGRFDAAPLADALLEASVAFETFFGQVLPVMAAIQSDAELRQEFGERMDAQGMGPHRGVELLAAWLDEQKRSGRVAAAVDSEAVAALLIGASFMRVFASRSLADKDKLPSREQTVATLATLLTSRD